MERSGAKALSPSAKGVRGDALVGDTDVTIVLPATTDCDALGAVCTKGGKKLSKRTEATVPDPAAANSPATGPVTLTGTAWVVQL